MALSSYSTGLATVSAGGTTVTGSGTIWSGTNVKPGDIFQIGNFQSVIEDVTDTTHLVIPPWGGGNQSGVAYTIWQVSPQRFAGAEAMATVNELVAAFNTSGFFVFVDIDETDPDPSLGDDGQFAFQPTTGKTWERVAGVWTYLGIYKGFNLTGAWSGSTDYTIGDVVTLSGSSYVCILDHTNHTPPNATYWQLLASKGDTGATGAAGAGYGGTSTTSLALGTGSKAFTTQAGLAYTNGARVRASYAADPSNYWMEGVATYSGTTLTITVDKVNNSGTWASWNFNIVGQPGAGDLTSTNNLSDLASAETARKNLGIPLVLQGYISGLTLSTAGSSSTFAVAAGVAVDDSNTDFMRLAASISKTTAAWAVGTGNGALDTGTIANSTWYHVFEIKRPDTGVVDILISTSATAPTMPTNYTLKRRIGSMKTNGSGQWTKFTQFGDEFLWDTPVAGDATSAALSAATLFALTVPSGVQVFAKFTGYTNSASGNNEVGFSSPDQTAGSTDAGGTIQGTGPSTYMSFGLMRLRTNTARQIRAQSVNSCSMRLTTHGWEDLRGKI
ncbi:carbohydrate-binding protein [Bradyrhizobium ottawaense]|uniref:carbohydrate-binding protein n=1 Tax=Bradyrhizobium ottawaense TaxID=931866 RepID=UPI001FE232CB|nr:carbohydrate-binding protein [Bradyrhizobium ottawaense]